MSSTKTALRAEKNIQSRGNAARAEARSKIAPVNLAPVIPARQQSKIDSRRKLLTAARKLFTTLGYEDTRPQDIVREAGMGYGTFYLHFADKHECFIAFAADVEAELLAILDWSWPTDDDSPAKFFPIMLRAIFDYSVINPGVMRVALMDAKVLSMVEGGGTLVSVEKMNDLIGRWQRLGHVSPAFDTPVVTHLMMSTVKTADALATRNPDQTEKIIDNLVQFLVNALRA